MNHRTLCRVLVLLAALLAGCSWNQTANRAIDSVNDAIGKLDSQMGKANATFDDVKNVLVGLKANLDDEKYKRQIDDLIGRTGQVAQITYSGSLDFTRTRVKEDLQNLVRSIRGEPPVERVPILANTESPTVDFKSTSRQSLTIVGWNLDVAEKNPAKYTIMIQNLKAAPRAIDRSNVGFQGQYAVTLNTSKSGIVFQTDDKKIVFAGFDPAFEVLVVNSEYVAPVVTPPPQLPTRYALIFKDSHDPADVLWKVNSTDVTHREIGRADFKKWCTRFNTSDKIILGQEEVAGDEHFKLSGSKNANWWTASPYNLPPLIERWFQIMDDERWYVFTYRNKSAAVEHTER